MSASKSESIPPAPVDGNDEVLTDIRRLSVGRDPNSLPDNPVAITYHDICSACYTIRDAIKHTPLKKSHLSEQLGMDIYLKIESAHHTGSFKERGARCVLANLSEEQKQKGVCAASTGNFAQAISYHGKLLNVPVKVYMPEVTPPIKIQKTRRHEPEIIIKGSHIGECRDMALNATDTDGTMYVSGCDHPDVIAGHGTVGLEILEQLDSPPDAVIAPVGGGSLIAGLGVVMKTSSPKTLIIGVESIKAPTMTTALKYGRPAVAKIESTIADGLAVPVIGYNTFYTGARLVDKMLTVTEEWIALAILRLAEVERIIVEGAAAVGLAAILSGQLDELKGKKVVLVLTGSNIDSNILMRCFERALTVEGRLLRLKVRIHDCSEEFGKFIYLLGLMGAKVKEVTQERAFLKDIFLCEVRVICETESWCKTLEIRKALKEKYDYVEITSCPMLKPDSC